MAMALISLRSKVAFHLFLQIREHEYSLECTPFGLWQ